MWNDLTWDEILFQRNPNNLTYGGYIFQHSEQLYLIMKKSITSQVYWRSNSGFLEDFVVIMHLSWTLRIVLKALLERCHD